MCVGRGAAALKATNAMIAVIWKRILLVVVLEMRASSFVSTTLLWSVVMFLVADVKQDQKQCDLKCWAAVYLYRMILSAEEQCAG